MRMYVMTTFNKNYERELKISPRSKVDSLFNEVKTFFFESHRLSHYIEEFDFRGVLNRRYPRPFKAKNIKSVFIERRTSDGEVTNLYSFEDEGSLRRALRSFVDEATEEERVTNEGILDEIASVIRRNCLSTDDYEHFRNHVKSFFHFSGKR